MTKIIPLLFISLLINSCSIKKIIYVADSYVNCENTTSEKCLQIKENKEDGWVVFEGDIEGFEYKEGNTHKIEVEISKTKKDSSLKYKLIKIIYQEESKIENTSNNILSGSWSIISINGLKKLATNPTINFDAKNGKISGNAGCNSYGTTFSIEGEQLKFETPFATKMYCTNMNVEKAFFDCLQNASYYKFVNDKLIFFAKDDKELMMCSKIEK